MIGAGNRAKLALTKTARKRYVEELGDHPSIVVLLFEHAAPPAGAGKDQGGTDVRVGKANHPSEIGVGTSAIAHVKPKGLPHARLCCDRKATTLGLDTQQASHQKIADVVVGSVLVNHDSCHQPNTGEMKIFRIEGTQDGMELLDRRLACQLQHDIAFRGRHHKIAPDWSGTLRNDRGDSWHIDPNPNCTLRQDALRGNQAGSTGGASAGKTTHQADATRICRGEKTIGWCSKRIRKDHDHASTSRQVVGIFQLDHFDLIAWEYASPETNRGLLLGLLADTNHATRNHRTHHLCPGKTLNHGATHSVGLIAKMIRSQHDD